MALVYFILQNSYFRSVFITFIGILFIWRGTIRVKKARSFATDSENSSKRSMKVSIAFIILGIILCVFCWQGLVRMIDIKKNIGVLVSLVLFLAGLIKSRISSNKAVRILLIISGIVLCTFWMRDILRTVTTLFGAICLRGGLSGFDEVDNRYPDNAVVRNSSKVASIIFAAGGYICILLAISNPFVIKKMFDYGVNRHELPVPYNDESVSEYIQRSDPDLYDTMKDIYDDAVSDY